MLGVGRVRSKKKNKSRKNNKKSAPPKTHHDIHSSPATATARDGARRNNVQRVLAHTRLHRSRVCGNRPRTALAIAYGKNGLGRFVPSACLLQQMVQKKEKQTTNHRHQQSSQRPPQGIPLLQSFEVALERVSDSLGTKSNNLPASVDSAPTWSEVSTISKRMQTSPCTAAFWREPQENQSQGTQQRPLDIVLLITSADLLSPIPSPPAVIGDSSLGS